MSPERPAATRSFGALQNLFGFNDGPWRWWAGVQVAVATGAPLAIFTLAGRQSWGLMASLGAFTVLYGSTLRSGDRIRALPFVAAGFVAASGLGSLSAANAGLTIAGLVVVAALACMTVLGARLGPPGPMQFVLVAGVSAHLAAPARLGGSSLDPFRITALVAVGALIASGLLAALLALPLARLREVQPVGLRPLFPPRALDEEATTIAARVVVAVAVAGLLSLFLGARHSYWIIMVAGAVLQTTHVWRSSVTRVVHRILGTVMGVAVFGLISLMEPKGLWLVGVLTLLQCAIEVVVVRHYALALTFITPTALIISAAAGTADPFGLACERIIDTVLGAVAALIVLWAGEWLRAHRQARRSAPIP